MMQKRKVLLKHRIEYAFFVFFLFVIKTSPLMLLKTQKKITCFLFKKFSKKHSKIVSVNLKIAFPNLSEMEISDLKDKIYYHFSSIFIEILSLFLKKSPKKILKKIEVNHLEYITDALKQKKGLILFSGHFGNWELAPFILSRKLNTKLFSIAREMDNPMVERVIKRFREYMGSIVIYKKGSIRTILKQFDRNKIVCFLIDQNTVPREATFVDFFSRKTSVIATVSQLHLKRGTPVIPLFLHYETDKIVVDVLKKIAFNKTDNNNDDKNVPQ